MRNSIISLVFSMLSAQVAVAGNIGPFDVDLGFCEDAEQLSSLTQSWQAVQYPVAGMPGIVFGINQNTNQILEYCKYMIMMEQLNQSRSMNKTLGILNKLTDSRWAEEMDLIQNINDIGHSSYNFKNSRNRKSSLNGARINSSLKKMVRGYSQVKKKYDPVEDANMVQLAGAAQKRAVLSEMISCPKPENPDKDYGAVYENEIMPLEETIADRESDAKFYQGRVAAMGLLMFDPYTLRDFEKELYSLESNAIKYEVSVKPENSDTVVKTGKKGTDGKAETKTETVSRDVQTITTKEDSKVVREFRDKWGPYWKAYTLKRMAAIEAQSGGRDRDLARMSFENDMRRTVFDCPPTEINSRADSQYKKSKILKEPLADQAYAENLNKCVAATRVNQSSAEAAFDSFVKRYMSNASEYKVAQAKYWSAQSKYLGINVSINQTTADGIAKDEVQCSDKMSMADMQTVSNELQQVNLSQNEIIAQSALSTQKLEEARDQRDRDFMSNMARKDSVSTRSLKEEPINLIKSSQSK